MSPERIAKPGILLAVVGPSGAGKDTLLRMALNRLGCDGRLRLARRIITRPAGDASEDHASVGEAEFERLERSGAFCLTWRAHGLRYGVPRLVADDVDAGALGIANLSRRSLAQAAERFARLAVAEITAPDEVLIQRIQARGRETGDEIARRLARQVPLVLPAGTLRFARIENSGAPDDGADRLAEHIHDLLDLLPMPETATV